MQNIEFSVKDMDCKSCVNVILKKLKAMEGVKDVKIDPATKKVKVEWDNPKRLRQRPDLRRGRSGIQGQHGLTHPPPAEGRI